MTRYGKELKLLALVALMAFAVCWLISPFAHRSPAHPDPHQYLHDQLAITPAQDKQLVTIESRFAARKMQLEATIREANAELAKSIMNDKRYSEQVKAAVDTIHRAQGELQKATLEHLFEMQSALTPEQSEKLNRMAADALLHHP